MSTVARPVAFQGRGLSEVVNELTDEVRELYTADEVPWVIGYSGGKDSTAVLQLVWLALQGLPAEQRTKPVHVISTDTLVENPIVAAWVSQSLETMKRPRPSRTCRSNRTGSPPRWRTPSGST